MSNPYSTGRLGSGWWLLCLAGLVGIAAGVIVLVRPGHSLITIAVIMGIFVLVDGIVEIAASFSRATPNRGFVALLGAISAVLGVLLIRHPIAGVVAVALLIGLWLIAAGTVRLVLALELAEDRAWRIGLAALEMLCGIVIVAIPGIGLATLALLVGISFILNGIGLLALGWKLRGLAARTAPQHPAGAAPA